MLCAKAAGIESLNEQHIAASKERNASVSLRDVGFKIIVQIRCVRGFGGFLFVYLFPNVLFYCICMQFSKHAKSSLLS